MSTKISIADIPKALLLKALWERSKPAAFFAMSGFPASPFDENAALEELERNRGYLDYLQGRVIKANLGGDEASPRMYDRDNGEGAFAEVVEGLRKTLGSK